MRYCNICNRPVEQKTTINRTPGEYYGRRIDNPNYPHQCDLRLIIDTYGHNLADGSLIRNERKMPDQSARFEYEKGKLFGKKIDRWKNTRMQQTRWVHTNTLKPGGANYID